MTSNNIFKIELRTIFAKKLTIVPFQIANKKNKINIIGNLQTYHIILKRLIFHILIR